VKAATFRWYSGHCSSKSCGGACPLGHEHRYKIEEVQSLERDLLRVETASVIVVLSEADARAALSTGLEGVVVK
jgi:hypothetical protein